MLMTINHKNDKKIIEASASVFLLLAMAPRRFLQFGEIKHLVLRLLITPGDDFNRAHVTVRRLDIRVISDFKMKCFGEYN